MAISKFVQSSGSTNLSTFFQWLNAHKEGTFLEDLTLTNTTTTNTNDTIHFADTDSSAEIRSRTGSGTTVFEYISGSFSYSRTTQDSSASTAYVVGALLCDKGLIVQYYGKYDSSNANDCYGVCLTVDSNGKLAALVTSQHFPNSSTQITQWVTCATSSTANANRACRPLYGANLTSFAPITAQGIDDMLTLPYAYAAISTQLNQEGLYAVSVNGDNYITNGVWYIKDGD